MAKGKKGSTSPSTVAQGPKAGDLARNNSMPNYLGIGKVQLNDDFLNQVAASGMRLERERTGQEARAGASTEPTEIETPKSERDEARTFIKSYFMLGDQGE